MLRPSLVTYGKARLAALAELLLVALTPDRHGVRNGLQALTRLRERILHPRRHIGIDLPVDQTTLLHGPQLGGQDLHVCRGAGWKAVVLHQQPQGDLGKNHCP